MYFTADGRSAIVVAEALKRLDFRDPQTMTLQSSLAVPQCAGINHADFSIDGRFAIFTCEFAGQPGEDRSRRPQRARLSPALARAACPRTSACRPTARSFFVADMKAGGVFVIDGDDLHGDRASSRPASGRTGSTRAATAPGSTSPTAARPTSAARRTARGACRVIDFATRKVVATWPIPGGGSPDMGNVERGRQDALALRPLRQRRLRHRHDDRPA